MAVGIGLVVLVVVLHLLLEGSLAQAAAEAASGKHDTPDAVYVIGMEQCGERRKRARAWALRKGLRSLLCSEYVSTGST